MAIQPRQEWTRQCIAELDALCAGRRNGARSHQSDDQAESLPESRERAAVPITPPGPEGCLKVYPDVGAACIKERLDLPYRLWLLLRPAHGGRGRITLEDAYNLTVGTRRQTRQWLRQGTGAFWTRNAKGEYHLEGLESVAKALNTPPEKQACYVPLRDVEDVGRFRATMYAAWFVNPVTISQARLSKIFGRKPKTLQRWAKLAGLEVGHNLAWTHLPDEADLQEKAAKVRAGYYWTEQWDGRPDKRRKRGDKPDEMVALVWTQPNTYRAPLFERAPKTRLQRNACQALYKLSTTLRAADQRVYCPRGPGQSRQAARLLEAGGIALVEEARAHHGFGLWEYQE